VGPGCEPSDSEDAPLQAWASLGAMISRLIGAGVAAGQEFVGSAIDKIVLG